MRISAEQMASRQRCARAVALVWEAIDKASEADVEMTTAEWMWVLNRVMTRVIEIEMKADEPAIEVESRADGTAPEVEGS